MRTLSQNVNLEEKLFTILAKQCGCFPGDELAVVIKRLEDLLRELLVGRRSTGSQKDIEVAVRCLKGFSYCFTEPIHRFLRCLMKFLCHEGNVTLVLVGAVDAIHFPATHFRILVKNVGPQEWAGKMAQMQIAIRCWWRR